MTPTFEPGTICVGCGLCCDGTLHPYVSVAADEREVTAAVGLAIVEENGKHVFRQPCPLFGNCSCTVYSVRPPICRRYRCLLLANVDAGRITVEEAREKITTAKTLLAGVIASAPAAAHAVQRSATWNRLQAGYGSLGPDDRLAASRALLAIAALDRFLERWFRKKTPKIGSDA